MILRNNRTWVIAAGTYSDELAAGRTPKAARILAAANLRRHASSAEIEADLPELKRLGSMAYGIALRAIRVNRAKR